MLSRRTLGFLALAMVLLLALVNTMVIRTSNRAPDDGYISLRYADNLAGGHGLRFNPEGERVEGFSSPLHVLTMAVLIKSGFDPRAVSQFSSLSAALLCIMVVGVWGQRKFGVLWGSLAAMALALNQGFSFWARSGMETTGFALLILLAVITAYEGRWRTMGALGGLISLMRPEGVIYLAPLFAYAVVAQRRAGRPLRDLVPAALFALIPFAGWFLFRVVYFHDVLPNTYYAKMDGLSLSQAQRGLEYIGSFVRLSENMIALFLIGLATLLWVVRRRTRTAPAGSPSWQTVGMGSMACTAYFVLSSGGDWMHQHRFIQPALPILVLLTGWAGLYLGCSLSKTPGRVVVTTLAVLVFVSQSVRIFSHDLRHPHHPLDRPLGLVEPWDDFNVPLLYKLGLQMRQIAPAGATFALCAVGSFSFAWEGTVIDMLGLNDRQIARLPLPTMGEGRMGHEKGNGQVVLDRKPDFILLRVNPNPEVGVMADPDRELEHLVPIIQIWNDESFHRDYEPFLVEINDRNSFTVFRRIAGGVTFLPQEKPWNNTSTR